MNTPSVSSVHSALSSTRMARLQYDRLYKEFTKKMNQFFNKTISDPENCAMNKLRGQIELEINQHPYVIKNQIKIKVHLSSYYLLFYIHNSTFLYGKDIGSYDLRKNSMNFRRNGSPSVTKVIKFSRDKMPAQIVKYILRFSLDVKKEEL